jgi:CheY-like chemotaxis protein
VARVLIIDDDDGFRLVLAEGLSAAGHTVTQAADGRLGLEAFRAQPTDIVVVDLVMPVQEGIETISILRREHPNLPLIAISGSLRPSMAGNLRIAGHLGAHRTLAKPFSVEALLKVIAELLPAQG